MKKSTVWLGIFVGAIICTLAVLVCTIVPTTTGDADVYAAESAVDLEALAKSYKQHVKSGSKDLAAFEAEVNKPPVYHGSEKVEVTMDDSGSVIGYVEQSAPGYQKDQDKMVFALDADQQEKRIVARDNYHRHYGLSAGDVFGIYMISRMLDRQRGYYGGSYWRPSSNARWARPGYHGRIRSSFGRSHRSGSFGSRRSGSGGFGFGK